MACGVAVLLVAVFFRWFAQQHRFSSNNMEDWGHAYLMPLISGYVVWLRRSELASLRPRTCWGGVAPLSLGLVCYAFFTLMLGNHMLAGGALLLTLAGVVLLLLGTGGLRLLAMPLALLAFGITISEQIMIELTFRLQLVASQGAYVLLSLIGPIFGFKADLSGNQIHIIESSGAEHAMEIAQACAGMRTVVAFVALAAAVAVLGAREWWQRIALMLLAVPVAVFMNVVRIGVLGVLTLVNPGLAEGEAHTFIGTVLLIPALGLFMLTAWALKRIVRPERAP